LVGYRDPPIGLLEASSFIEAIQRRQGYIACLEEIVYNKGWIDKEKVLEQSEKLKNTNYGKCLADLVRE